MQKFILLLITLIFIGIIFFIQTKQKVKKHTSSSIKQTKVFLEPTKTKLIDEEVILKPKRIKISSYENNKLQEKNETHSHSQSIEEMRVKTFEINQAKINMALSDLPDCLENAQTKQEAFKCNEKLVDLGKEAMTDMGITIDKNRTSKNHSFIWDEETKVKIINEIENDTQKREEMEDCMEAAISIEDLDKCFKIN